MAETPSAGDTPDSDSGRFHQPHDRFVRNWFQVPETAAEFLSVVAPASLRKHIRPENLTLENVSFVDEELRRSESDLLWKCESEGQTAAWFYVLWEHQTRADPWMPVRMLNYISRIWDRWLRSFETSPNPAETPLPLIVPVVLYQGKTPWKSATRLDQLMDIPDDMAEMVPNFAFDLRTLNVDSELPEGLAQLGIRAMKLYWHQGDEFLDWLREILPAIASMSTHSRKMLRTLFTYIFSLSERTNRSILVEVLEEEPTISTSAMNLLEESIEEGREKGLREGRSEAQRELVHVMAGKGLSVEEIAQLTDLSPSDIQQMLAKDPV